jgi:hypothetical protein
MFGNTADAERHLPFSLLRANVMARSVSFLDDVEENRTDSFRQSVKASRKTPVPQDWRN